jgi:uncharacterized protein (DUF362 family)
MRTEKPSQVKSYIGIVDAIIAGEGDGPLSPDPVALGRIISGTNPVAIDASCATLIGFDPLKIPTIANAFKIRHSPLCNFTMNDISILLDGNTYGINNLPAKNIMPFRPQYGWNGHIEK